jgi:hypothetical protein
MIRRFKALFFTLTIITVLLVFIAPSHVSAATNVYYSAGQNTLDHKTGSPTITISGGLATFSVAQTGTTTGVGDKVTYNGSSVAYISGKVSTTQWNVVTATGGTPANVTGQTVNSIAHAFDSIKSALSAASVGADGLLGTGDLVTGNYILNIPLYYDSGRDVSLLNFAQGLGGSRYTTGPSNYIKIYAPASTTAEVNTTQRHAGKYENNKVLLDSWYLGTIFYINYVQVEGLQMNKMMLSVGSTTMASSHTVTGNLISKFLDSNPGNNAISIEFDAGYGTNLSNRNVTIYNNVIGGWDKGIGSSQTNVFTGTIKIYNNTFYDIPGAATYYEYGSGSVYKNNLFASTTSAFNTHTYVAGSDYNATDKSTLDYTVTGGGNTHDRVNQTFSFVDAANLDLHLTGTDASARNFGADLSGENALFAFDFEGQARPQQSVWDIGADEYLQVTSAPTVTTVAATSIATSTAAFNATIVATGGSNATQSGFAYGTASDLSTVIATSTLGAQTGLASFNQSVSGLIPSTTYYFRAYAVNTSGTSTGSILSFTTGSAPALTTSVATSIGMTGVAANGSISSIGGASPTTRGFVYGVTTAYGATTTASGSFGTGVYTLPVTGLTCNTLYHIKAYATNSNGTGYGSDQTFTTGACVAISTFNLPRSEVYAPGWLALSDRIMTQHGGEYVKFAVQNTANVAISVDTSALTSNIYLVALVDGATTTTTFVGTGSTTLSIASGLSLGRHEVYLQIQSLSTDNERWTDQTTMLQIQNVYLDSGASILVPAGINRVRPTYAVWLTDSLGEYLNSTVSVNDVNLTFPTRVSNYFSWEHEHRAFSATGYVNSYIATRAPLYTPGGPTNQAINAYDSTHSRLSGGKLFGDVLVIALGTNDIGTTSTGVLNTRVQQTISYARSIFDGSIYVQLPFYSDATYLNTIASAYHAYKTATSSDTRTHLIDVGTSTRTTLSGQTIDGTHLSVTGQTTASAALQTLYSSNFDTPTAPLSVTAVGGVGQATLTFATSSSNGGSPILTYTASSSPGTVVFATTTGPVNAITVTGLTPGTYTFRIKATNAVGDSVYSASSNSVSVSDTVPPVISSIASSTTATTATISWNTDENATSTVEYGLTASYGFASTSALYVTSRSIVLTGLTGNTLYYFRVSSTDSSGNTATSSSRIFTTTPIAPTLTTSSASSLTQTTATLNDSITATGGANATQSGFAYGTSSLLTTNTSTSTLGAQTGTASFSDSVSGLTCNTTYYFRSYATNSGGTGYGSIASFVTSACLGTVTTQSASSLTLSSATLNGNITATGGANATVRGFTYGLTTAYGATTTESGSFSTGAYTASVSSLACNTTYNISSYSTNTAGTSYGTNTTFLTAACAAPTLTTDAATSLAKTTATLNATIGATGGNNATQSGFTYSTTSALTLTIATSTLGAQSGAVSFAEGLGGLTCETTYYFRPYATNLTGTSYGSILSFTTSSCTDPVVVTQTSSSGSSARRVASNLASRVTTFFTGAPATPSASTPVSAPTLSTFIEALIKAGVVPADKVEAARAITSTVTTPTISSTSFKRDLQLHDSGSDVKTLQTLLISKGFLPAGKNTGTFGAQTLAALKKYQASVGVTATGYFGPRTRAGVR